MPKTPDHLSERFRYFMSFNISEIIGGLRARYPASYAFTKDFEGGYVNDPDDPGGCTNAGITIGTLQAWRGDSVKVTCADVAALSEPEIGLIYATNYWAPVWGNRLPVGINCQVWDLGVNAGPSRAIKILQGLVDETQDGIMGPKTLAATEDADQDDLLVRYHAARQEYYESLSTFSKYGDGWTRRNDECLTLSQELLFKGPAQLRPIDPKPKPPSDLEARVSSLEGWARTIKEYK